MLTKTFTIWAETIIFAAGLAARGTLARLMQGEEKNPSQPLSHLIIIMLSAVTNQTAQMHTDA